MNPQENLIMTAAELIRPYSGEWVTVCVNTKRVLGHSPSFKTAVEQARNKGESRLLVLKSPDANTAAFLP